jgi:serine/threonine-protein kinase
MLPFLFFLGGYITVHFFFNVNKIVTPSLVGKNVYQALIILSEHKLNPRILDEKEDPDLPSGTIVSQTPVAGQKIKPHQSIYLLISKRPPAQKAPNLLNKKLTTIKKKLRRSSIHSETYAIPHTYPKNHCFAQSPPAHDSLKHNTIIAYVSADNNMPIIWPNFTGYLVTDVLAFLQSHNIYPQIIHQRERQQRHVCSRCTVQHQHPRAGSLITLNPNRPFRVQLRVN